MKTLPIWLIGAASAALALAAPAGQAAAQMTTMTEATNPAAVGDHGDWTLKQREDWLNDRLRAARDDGSIDSNEFDRVHHDLDGIHDDENHMRGDHDGQLTDNETIALEGRLDSVADQIHWLHEDQFRKPW
jgi:hypothetical protein